MENQENKKQINSVFFHKKIKNKYNYIGDNMSIIHKFREYLLEEEQFKVKLEKAIANLTESQRTAFLLHRIEGKKYSEIAVMLDISVKAVEKRIHGALLSLRANIEQFK